MLPFFKPKKGFMIAGGGLETAAGGGGGSGINFSTNEVDTGDIWSDGKKIYCRVLEGESNSQTNTVDISTLGVSQILNVCGFCIDDNTTYGVDYWSATSTTLTTRWPASVDTGSPYKVVIYYTKAN